MTWEELQHNEYFQPFLSPNFDVSTQVSCLLESASTSLQALNTHIAAIDQEIHSNVSSHHEDLLAQTSNVEVMEKVVNSCGMKATSCLSSVDAVKSKVNQYCQQYEDHVNYLENLYKVNEAMRRLSRVIRIEKSMCSADSSCDVATYIMQIEEVSKQEPQLTVLSPYYDYARSLKESIEKQTENLLSQGLQNLSQPQVSLCVQVFVNLNILEEKLNKIFTSIENLIEKDVQAALNIKVDLPSRSKAGPGRAAASNISDSSMSSKIWENLSSLTSQLLVQTSKAKLLWSCVVDRRDSTSNLSFESFLPNSDTCWLKFWNNFVDIFIHNFTNIKQDFIKYTFENEFPKLLVFFTNLGTEIEKDSKKLSVQPGLRGVISVYEKAFLSKSLSKLHDSVGSVFSTVPSLKEIDNLIKIIKAEVDVSDPMLKKLVSRNLHKTIKMVCAQSERLIFNNGDSTQVIGSPTEAQIANARLVNGLFHFRTSLKENCESVDILITNFLSPLITAVEDAVEAILLTMHKEKFQRTNKATEYSLYIGELQSFISRVARHYFSLYECPDVMTKCGAQLASRTIDLFIRNVSLIPSLQLERTTNQILTDLNHLEIALTPIFPVISELGKPYKVLKGFKTLLGLTMEEVTNSSLVGNVITYTEAMHLLFKFSNGCIKYPHAANGWSVSRYSKWLDEHPQEGERLMFLKSTLDKYVEEVKEKGEHEFHPVYPHMLTLLQKGLKH